MRGTGIALIVTGLLLAGCGGYFPIGNNRVPDSGAPAPAAPSAPVATPELSAPAPKAGARTADALDTTTPEQRAAATASPAPAAQAALGKVTVGLGDPTASGFWLKTGLVKTVTPGLIKTAGGQTVQVELQPGEGAAQLSLAAFRALGLSLTDLPEVEVFAR
ncbi:D-galactarate dehydratase [Gemmobacter serpentinus]|uniref:D-galactarate dehydratase n=1 Tax=Gemmobacter serpentinus TaxID=2652247 RepID=UPI001CF6322F|nr:D-galactarate dehydratase [Gemmobacter serpentinus]